MAAGDTGPPAYAGAQAQRATYATLTADDLVTGEAVALDLPPAGLGARMVSGLLDVLATVVLLLVTGFVFLGAGVRSGEAIFQALTIALVVTVFLVWPTTLETLTRGKSLGKMAMGLRTVRDDAGPISFQHAFVRALIGFVEIYAFSGGPAFLSAMLSSRGKRLGDYAAGTYVVRERVVLRLPRPAAMPPALAGWAAAADIRPLPTGLALAARRVVDHSAQLDLASRHALAAQIAEQVREHVAPQPPAQTPPEAFLAAVLAARRERDAARLAREEDLRRRLADRG